MYPFWHKQSTSSLLFPDIEWNRPERQDQAGKLGIIGGTTISFAAVSESYAVAKETGAGRVQILLPDTLKKIIPPTMTDVLFALANSSGGLGIEAERDIKALAEWADVLLLCGDAGKNSQTATLYESLLTSSTQPIVLTRDAIDLVQNGAHAFVQSPYLTFVASFAQIQRLFRAVYYPKVITFSMQLAQLVDVLHKFTVSYPVSIVTYHAGQIIAAHGGEVVTQEWENPMQIWRGHIAAQAATYLLWSPEAPLAAIATSFGKAGARK